MKTSICCSVSSLAAALLLAFGSAQAAQTTDDEYKAAKDRVEADYKAAKAECDKLSGNTKDICVAQAKTKQSVGKAEAQYNHTGKAKDKTKVAMAQADGDYNTAKERCDDRSGNDKDVCVKEAKAAHTKAVADAKAAKKVSEVRGDAAKDKNEANYKVAIEKCDALSGDAKSACVADAKAKYNKS